MSTTERKRRVARGNLAISMVAPERDDDHDGAADTITDVLHARQDLLVRRGMTVEQAVEQMHDTVLKAARTYLSESKNPELDIPE